MLALPYEKQYGLFLNINRVRTQLSSAFMAGFRAASGDHELPREWFDAVCGFPETVDDAMNETNLARSVRQLLAGRGR